MIERRKAKKKGRSQALSKKSPRLTQTVNCAGCASKLNPALLRKAVFNLSQPFRPELLVGFSKADDAGVYQIGANQALVQTVDFFTPIVDDPYLYGQIAATNSLSDVYAMGGDPLTALNILCYPEDMGVGPLKKILKGALDKIEEAQCTLVGGHSVNDPSMKFGLSVTGLINPKRIFSNDQAQPGQVLVLTKPLGTGIVVTAAKYEDCPKDLFKKTVRIMATLNKMACEAMMESGATACTDITGFSLLGHMSEMVRASQVSIQVFQKNIPFDDRILGLIDEGYITAADVKNRVYAGQINLKNVKTNVQHILYDPQTSGGLLVSMPREDFPHFQDRLQKVGQEAWLIGEVLGKDPKGQIEII